MWRSSYGKKQKKDYIFEICELLEIINIDNILPRIEKLMKDSWRLEKYREVHKLLAEQAILAIEKLEELKRG